MGNGFKPGVRAVEETDIGVYVWKMPDGRWVGDDQNNFACIAARKGDLKRIAELASLVRSCGVTEGAAYFLPGRRKVNDDEHAEQEERMMNGLIPDQYDIPALIEEMKQKRERNKG